MDRLVGQATRGDRLVHRLRARACPGRRSRLPAISAIRRWPRSSRWSTAWRIPVAWSVWTDARAELGGQVAVEQDDRDLELGQLLERRRIASRDASDRISPSTRRLRRNRMCATSSAGWPSESMNISE